MINKHNPEILEKHTKKQPCVILFHMDGCPHCQGVKKVWPEFKRNMSKKHKTNIPFIDVNANALPFINQQKFNIRGFPSIVKSIPNKDYIEEFSGPDRSKESLIRWFENKFNREIKPTRRSMIKKIYLNDNKTRRVKKKPDPKKKKPGPKKKKPDPKKKTVNKKKLKKNKKTTKKGEDSIYESPRSSLFS